MEKVEKFFPKEKFENKEKLPPNVEIVETENGKFRIAYGRHYVERKSEEIGKADACVLEFAAFDYTLSKELVEENFNRGIRTLEYRKIIEKAQEEEKPIFLADILESRTVLLLQLNLKVLEPALGIVFLKDLIESLLKNEKMTRREFLKKTAVGVAGTYLSSEIPIFISGLLSRGKKGASRAINKFLIDLNERIHPETNAIILTLRNHLFAQKLETIARRLTSEIQNKKPEVAISVGKLHSGIEKALLKDDEERVKLIDKLLKAPGLKKTREKIAVIARLDFNKEEDKWKLTDRFKDPYLSKIEK